MCTPIYEELVVDAASSDGWIRSQLQEPTIPRKEFDILESREEIADPGWPERANGDVNDEDIDQYIRRLRRRVELIPSCPKLNVTLRGYGYRMS